MMDEHNLLWVDFETTGLMNMPHSEPIELAVVVTDFEGNSFYPQIESILMEPSKKALGEMNDYVTNMHTKTGLLQRIKTGHTWTRNEVDEHLERLIMKFFPAHRNGEYKGAVLAGNSVGFDMRVMEKFFPRSHSLLSYRVLDMTSVFQFVERSPHSYIAERMPDFGSDHTAFNDIQASISRYKYFMTEMSKING